MNFKKNEGITLVELVVAMATASLVFAAAATLLLMGLRINNLTTGTTIRQNKTRTVLTVMERLATEGQITGVDADEESWKILYHEDGVAQVRFTYLAKEKRIYVGDTASMTPEEKEANTLMEDVIASYVVMDENHVLTVAVETEEGNFSSSVFCRMVALNDDGEDFFDEVKIPVIIQTPSNGRENFIKKLSTQYRLKGGAPNRGLALSDDGLSMGEYYTEWYITTKYGQDAWNKDGWNKDTPWCACFVSWVLEEVQQQGLSQEKPMTFLDDVPKFAEVDSFKADFEKKGKWITSNPTPGDLIFFDWSVGNDPDHVGVVIKAESGDNYIYTIEGNSAGMVAVRRYQKDDPRIIGYGVLSWSKSEKSGN